MPLNSGARFVSRFCAFDATTKAYAQGCGASVGTAGVLRHQSKAQWGAAAELAPTIDGESEDCRLVFIGQADGNARGCIGVLQDVGAAKHLPATAPAGGIFGVNRNIAAAFDGFRASVIQGGLQVFCCLAHAPALDERAKAGAGDGRQYAQNGHDDHDFQQGESARLAAGSWGRAPSHRAR